MTNNVLAIILGGGRGTRLFPLTKDRSKPAVPLGGKYRLVDIPISNCINNNIKKIYILTQFNTASLHMHINRSFNFDIFSNGYIDILAAEQTPTRETWYQGTADAVRQNLQHFSDPSIEYFLILSGDQLYRMDFDSILEYHLEKKADVTVSVLPVERSKTAGFGILKVNNNARITDFVEKTTDPAILDAYKVKDMSIFGPEVARNKDKTYLASMGIYVFNRKAMYEALDNDMTDFGKHIIPASISDLKVFAYPYNGYWEDIGTIDAFYDANLLLTKKDRPFDFFDPKSPIFTHPRFLPPSILTNCNVTESCICEGCHLSGSKIHNSVVGIRSVVQEGSEIFDSILLGNDAFENGSKAQSTVPLGIGKRCRIERTIIDKNARIGDGTIIRSKEGCPNEDHDNYYVRDGIVIIPKHAVIEAGSVI